MLPICFIIISFLSVIRTEPIVNGYVTNAYPFVVYVQVVSEEKDQNGLVRQFGWKCGGTIIRRDAILTAAHCITDLLTEPSVYIFAGARKISSFLLLAQRRQGTNIKIHPDFYPRRVADLAIVQLNQRLVLSLGLVELATIGRPVKDAYGTAVGWGFTEDGEYSNELKKIQMKIISRRLCNSQLRNDNIICGWADNKKSTPCVGDSGGPFVLDGKVIGVIAKVLSVAVVYTKHETHKFCYGDKPTVFVDISKYLSWIQMN